MDYIQYLIYFGAYMAGVMLHEVCHWVSGKILAENVSMSLFGLRVEYDVPIENVARIRWISLSPLLLAILIVMSTFVLGMVDNLFIWLVVIGMVINTSSSDLSIKKALGEVIWIDNLSKGLKIAATGLLIWLVGFGMSSIENVTFGQQLFVNYISGVAETAATILIFIGIVIFLWDNQKSLIVDT